MSLQQTCSGVAKRKKYDHATARSKTAPRARRTAAGTMHTMTIVEALRTRMTEAALLALFTFLLQVGSMGSKLAAGADL